MSTDTYYSNLLKVMLTVPISNLNLYVHSWCFTFLYVFNVLQIPVTYVNVRVMTVCALIADLKKKYLNNNILTTNPDTGIHVLFEYQTSVIAYHENKVLNT